jgi:hypothetical protein
MAEETIGVKVQVDATGATKSIDELNKQIKDTGKNASKSGKDAAGAFNSIGNALKSLGVISLVVKGFEKFREILMGNQKVADFLSTSMNFLTGVLSDLVKFIVDNVGTVTDFFKDVFENPTKYVEKLGTAIKDNLIERVKSLIDAYGFLGKIIKNVFQGNFDEAIDNAKNFGKEVVDVFTGVDDSFNKTTKAVNEFADAAGNYFTKKLDQAKALTNATNAAIISEASLLNAVKKTEIAAEKLRQTRDNENISLKERIKANEDLVNVLQKGQKQELALVGIREQKVRNEIALNGTNVELQAELIRLQGERSDIEEKYTAFASEQLVNRTALLNEELSIQRLQAENRNKLTLDERKANAELIQDEILKLQVKRDIITEEAELELLRLNDIVSKTVAGTTARAEAEIAFAQKKAELQNQILATDTEILNKQLEKEKEYYNNLKELYIADQQANRELQDAKLNIAIQGLSALSAIAGENEKLANVIFAVQKAIEIGKIFTSTSAAIGQIIAQTQSIPIILPPGVPNPAYALAVATGAKRIATLKLGAGAQIAGIVGSSISKFKGGSASTPATVGVGGASAPIAPQGIAQSTNVTTLDQRSINQLGSATGRAYVVESDITNQQEKIIRINRAARLG